MLGKNLARRECALERWRYLRAASTLLSLQAKESRMCVKQNYPLMTVNIDHLIHAQCTNTFSCLADMSYVFKCHSSFRLKTPRLTRLYTSQISKVPHYDVISQLYIAMIRFVHSKKLSILQLLLNFEGCNSPVNSKTKGAYGPK